MTISKIPVAVGIWLNCFSGFSPCLRLSIMAVRSQDAFNGGDRREAGWLVSKREILN